LLVAGHAPAEVAQALEIPEDRLWKHLSRSLRFATHIRRAMDRQRLLAQIQYPTLQAQRLRDALQQPAPVPDLHWLSEAIGPAAPTNDNGNDPVRQLQQTAGRYPSQALRRRLAAEKAVMDAMVEESRVALAHHLAANPEPEQVATAPDKTQIAPDKTPTAPDKTQTAPDKTQTVPDKTQTAPDKPESASRPPPHPRPQRSAALRWGQPRISVVDLTDFDGNPLPGVEWPKPREKG
jgi:hypothetical protein